MKGVGLAAGPMTGATAASFPGAASACGHYVPTAALPGNWTVEAWFYIPAGASGGHIFGTRAPSDASFDLAVTSGSTHADLGTGTAWLVTGANWSGTVSTGTWHLMDFAVSTTGWDEYLDASQIATGTYSPSTPLVWDGTHTAYVGWDGLSGDNACNGSLADVAVYPSTLTGCVPFP